MTADRERGFALVSALWTAMILALIAASIVTTGRSDARIARIRAIAAQGAALADAGINAALYRLLAQDAAQRPPLDGTPFPLAFEGRAVTLRIQDETGKIDLNTAPASLLLGLLTSAGLDPDAAQIETDRIMDWRERGPLKRLNGAKLDDYRLAGYAYGPRAAAFLSIDELRLVMGITPALYENLRPAITVVSQLDGIDQTVAPLQALQALPGIDAEGAAAIIAARHRADGDNQGPTLSTGPADLTGRAFTIRADLVEQGRPASRVAIIRLSGDLRQPIWVYDWD